MKISFVGHSHHRITQSSRFFVEILAEIGHVASFWDETWRGEKPIELTAIAEESDLIVVWQSVSCIKRLAVVGHPNIVYVPMYDASKALRRSFWQPLNGTKILNFSSTLHQRVQQFGCRFSAYFQYFPNPEDYFPTSDFDSLRGFLWQRQARPGWDDVKKLIGRDFDSFHLHLAADPNCPKPVEPDPSERRERRIEVTHWFPEKSEMLEKLAASNVYFAPRLEEGIGLSFLEAMAMGMAVCAHDSPTHNEYIVDGTNGFLYSLSKPIPPNWTRASEIGRRARVSVEKGYRRWVSEQDRLLAFLTEPIQGFTSSRYARSAPAIRSDATRKCESGILPPGSLGMREGGKRIAKPDRIAAAPEVTVATVVRDAPLELAATLSSVIAQTYEGKEILVIDGGSGDATLNVVSAYDDDIDYWRSEPDQGPYDAMNKAAELAQGRWIIYINAGDSFVDCDALARFVSGVPKTADFVLGHHVYRSPEGVEEIHRCAEFESTYHRLLSGRTDGIWLSGIPGHQAVLTRVDLIRRHRFDLTYRIAADHEFMYRMRRLGASFHTEPVIVSEYVGGGLSSRNLFGCLEEWRAIALRYTENPQQVLKQFKQLFFATLKFSRRMAPFDWRSALVRSHPILVVVVEIEYWLRGLLDRIDALHALISNRR